MACLVGLSLVLKLAAFAAIWRIDPQRVVTGDTVSYENPARAGSPPRLTGFLFRRRCALPAIRSFWLASMRSSVSGGTGRCRDATERRRTSRRRRQRLMQESESLIW